VDDRMTVAAVFWGAVLDHLPVNADRLIALLYKRLPADEGSSENNLAWSITSKLKGKGYLSRYDPLEYGVRAPDQPRPRLHESLDADRTNGAARPDRLV
jgi:hypothetical protein